MEPDYDALAYSKTRVAVRDAMLWWGSYAHSVQTINIPSSISDTSRECVSNAPQTLPIKYVSLDASPERSANLTLTTTGG